MPIPGDSLNGYQIASTRPDLFRKSAMLFGGGVDDVDAANSVVAVMFV